MPSWCASDASADCDKPANFYGALLDNHFFWEQTWVDEGRMSLGLPARPQDTDGTLLNDQAVHSLVLDMITRGTNVWPRYGTAPGYDQAGVGADGFQEILTATMAGALEWGLFGYARDVLDNWLTYFVQDRGFVLYRGLEMAEQGRMLTNIAQYYAFTRDAGMLERHLDRIAGIGEMLQQRRKDALKLSNSSSAHGMPTGNDEADLAWATTSGKTATEMPFVSIATEMWRGLRDCGEVLREVAATTGNAKMAGVAASFLGDTPALLADIRASMAKDVFADGNGTKCHPYVAGVKECGMISPEASNRDSEPWRTYSELMYSGAVDDATIREIHAWHQTQQGSHVTGSRLKLGVLSGCGGDVHCGDQLETFTIHGWGYGLLQADLVEPFLLQFYALSAHAYTRGTWIAPESTPIDRTKASPPFATPSGLTVPILLKWALVYEHPTTRAVWIGKVR